jgi:hypothetical protein
VTSPAVPSKAPVSEIGYVQPHTSPAHWWMWEGETTPELWWPNSINVFDAMRSQDSQVSSVLKAVTLPVRRTPWRIDPAGARPEVVQLVAEDLGLPIVGQEPKPLPRTRDKFRWSNHLREALLMLSFGHMYFEQLYRIDPSGHARLRKLSPRMPKTIEEIDVAEDGGLVAIKQYQTITTRSPRPIPVNRLVAYINEREGGNWLGRSLLRACYKNWLIKDRLLRVQAQTVERNGMGVPLYTAPPGASESDIKKGAAMAKAWRAGENSGSAIPNEAKMQLLGVEGDLPDADKPIRYHDEQIARGVLAHFLNLGTETGSWALGSTFADFFTMSLQTLAQEVADVGTMHVVEDIVDLNWGPEEPAPKIIVDEIGSRLAATAPDIKALIDSGALVVDDELEAALRQMYGLPRADKATARPSAPKPSSSPNRTPAPSGPDERPGSVAAATRNAQPAHEQLAIPGLTEEE